MCVEYILLYRMNNHKNTCKVLIKLLTWFMLIYPYTRDFINKSLTQICRNKNLPGFVLVLFTIAFIFKTSFFLKRPYLNLWIAMHHYNKTKSEAVFLVKGTKINFD